MLEKAKQFAMKAHEGQVRKYTNEPYIEHPLAVAELIEVFVQDEATLTAAVLHDTVEDCDVTIEEIQKEFGDEVACYVWYLTKPPAFVGNRAKRKKIDRDRLQQAPKLARLIKIFDLWHNSKSIKEHDPKFWETFREEAKLLLDSMDAFSVICEFCGREFATHEFIEWFGDL
jgi:(p)ppGpp synthase/HD superfamily hydrolase